MLLFFFIYLLLRTNLWHRKFVTAGVTAVFVNNQHVFSDEDRILITSLYLKGYTAKRLTDEFHEKSWIKRGVNELLKKLRDTGTVDRRPGNCRPQTSQCPH